LKSHFNAFNQLFEQLIFLNPVHSKPVPARSNPQSVFEATYTKSYKVHANNITVLFSETTKE